MNICETEALCECVFCKERRKEGWKNGKEKKRKNKEEIEQERIIFLEI